MAGGGIRSGGDGTRRAEARGVSWGGCSAGRTGVSVLKTRLPFVPLGVRIWFFDPEEEEEEDPVSFCVS